MEYNYKKYTHRHKALKSAMTYLTRFYDNLALDYDGDSVYKSTVDNLTDIKDLCLKIIDRIDSIVSNNSKELNEVKYTYISLVNSAGNFKYLNYQAVIDANKLLDCLVNSTLTKDIFTYEVAEQLPKIILKSLFIYSAQSKDYEYLNYLRTLDVNSVDLSSLIDNVDFGHTALYAMVLYGMLWDTRLKPMGKYHTKYYLEPDSMCKFVSALGITDDVIGYYKTYKEDLIERVGIR